ncbi:MAG TPA: tRNA 2-thiouridine(34) synthase MnmA [Anaerolineae bacterium]|nr:tRNA 2-thiouridine(34) synthase MnmA [Anaerolineae bacterium]
MSLASTPRREHRKRGRVVVAMSGGVDSSAAAALLVKQGYEVIGLMMRLWSEPSAGPSQGLNRCCTPHQMADARRVAAHLDIPFYVLDAQDHFYNVVVRYFVDEHIAGRTPNPCIECNRQVRFSHLLDRALTMGADYLATGHYARVHQRGSEFELLRARDASKDQSYVLHVLGQQELARVMFPVGDYTKSEARDLARQAGLPVAEKSESMDLCFLADGDYRRFLRETAGQAIEPGPVLSQSGQEVGQHSGLANYTIGQRKGLGLSLGRPVYVLAKDNSRNALIVGDAGQLERSSLKVARTNWTSGTPPTEPIPVQVKIRYGANAVPAFVTATDQSSAEVRFDSPVKSVTAGQAAVFYDDDRCIGGGIICDEELE